MLVHNLVIEITRKFMTSNVLCMYCKIYNHSLLIHNYFPDDYEYTAIESDGERITDCDTGT